MSGGPGSAGDVRISETDARKLIFSELLKKLGLVPRHVEKKAGNRAGDVADDRSDWLIRRADEILRSREEPEQRLARMRLPPSELQALLPLAAAALGLWAGTLGPEGRIHAIVNPITALILWNVLIISGSVVLRLLGKSEGMLALTLEAAAGSPTVRPPAGPRWRKRLVAGAAAVRAWFSSKTIDARLRSEFVVRYSRVCLPAIWSRTARTLSLAAIGFAVGAVAGMYVQAIAFDYRVFWQSTLVYDPETRLLLLRVLFFPATLLLGGSFPGADVIAEMAGPSGTAGAIWIHVYAISALVLIVVPRAIMSLLDSRAAKWHAENIRLQVDDAYWEKVRPRATASASEEADEPEAESRDSGLKDKWRRRVEQEVLDVFKLDGQVAWVMASLQAGLIDSDTRATSARSRLPWDVLGKKRDWYGRWREIAQKGIDGLGAGRRIEALRATDEKAWPEAASLLDRSANPFAHELVLLELAAFEAYWPLEPPDPKSSIWKRVSRTIGSATMPSIIKGVRNQFQAEVCVALDLPEALAEELRAQMSSTNRALSDFWKTFAITATAGVAIGSLTMGIAAPFIGGLLGHVMGLAGAAATNAGLAALGGGAVAAGGLGVAGGTAVLVGGGALVGLGVAGGIGMLSPATTLIAAVKAEVFLRKIAWGRHKDKDTLGEILEHVESAHERLNDELGEHKTKREVSTSDLKDLEKTVAILRGWLDRNKNWVESMDRQDSLASRAAKATARYAWKRVFGGRA